MTFTQAQTGLAQVLCLTRGNTVAGLIRLALIFFITVSYFVQFTFYCNMQLIQFNVYFNHHVHIFMLSYTARYSHFRRCK